MSKLSSELMTIHVEGRKDGHNYLEHEGYDKPLSKHFTGIPKDELSRQAATFANQNGLADHVHWFQKGALIAQSPEQFESLEELNEADRQVLREEASHKWRQSRSLWFTIVTCSIGAAVQGWDQTGSNGANLSFPQQFGIGSRSDHDKLLVGLINAMPTIAMTVIGCWMSDPLNQLLGRRGTIFIAAVFTFSSVLGSAFTRNWEQLLACRILLGIGMGIKSSTTAIFAAESSPARIRGALVMTWQVWVAAGIFLGFSANIAVINFGYNTWRYQLGSAFIPAVPLLIMIFMCPESPRWYLKKERPVAAFESLCKLRRTPLQAARDMYLMQAQLAEEIEIIRVSGSAAKRFGQLFTIPRVRRATLAASVVMLSQQMCGINIIAFYSSTIFVEAGNTAKQALWASWGFGLCNFLFALPALRVIDTFGRRSLLLATFPNMAWSLLAAGLCYLIPGDGTGRLAAIAAFIFIFTIFYSVGEGPVCYAYGAEVFPSSHREIGMAFAVAVNAGGAAILGVTFPYMLEKLTPTGAFGFYCGTNILALVLVYLFVPETRLYTLEELDDVFNVPTGDMIKYQVKEVLPWWYNRWVRHEKGAQRLRLTSVVPYGI